jgi:hypothetical protein
MKAKKKPEVSMHLELEGKVFITEKQGRTVLTREEIDGTTVLQVLIAAISEGTQRLETDAKFRAGAVRAVKAKKK